MWPGHFGPPQLGDHARAYKTARKRINQFSNENLPRRTSSQCQAIACTLNGAFFHDCKGGGGLMFVRSKIDIGA